MTKETKSSAELQALFNAELSKLGIPDGDKLTIQPVANNARFSWSVFEASAGKDDGKSIDTKDALSRLQDRYDLSDET
jgi:hypothetical protein